MDIYLFGDSNSRAFTTSKQKVIDIKNNVKLHNFYKDSITIRGLNNPNSTTRYGDYILNTLRFIKNKNNTIVLLKIGQIDLEYSYYYKTIIKKDNKLLNNFFEDMLLNYKIFIDKIRKIHNFKIIISSINLPSYLNEDYFRNYLRFIFSITQSTQIDYVKSNNKIIFNQEQEKKLQQLTIQKSTMNIMKFNKKLQEFCISNNLIFLDTTDEFFDRHLGIIKKEFVGKDNHYVNIYDKKDSKIQEIFLKKLLDLLNYK